jgi:hypothetical protein
MNPKPLNPSTGREGIETTMSAYYEADDRGNVVDFYNEEYEIVARLDREAEVDGIPDQKTWDGGPDVTEWAIANGYADEIATARRI